MCSLDNGMASTQEVINYYVDTADVKREQCYKIGETITEGAYGKVKEAYKIRYDGTKKVACKHNVTVSFGFCFTHL
jgi:hypothetical protein